MDEKKEGNECMNEFMNEGKQKGREAERRNESVAPRNIFEVRARLATHASKYTFC